jgi:hypothetical protein
VGSGDPEYFDVTNVIWRRLWHNGEKSVMETLICTTRDVGVVYVEKLTESE